MTKNLLLFAKVWYFPIFSITALTEMLLKQKCEKYDPDLERRKTNMSKMILFYLDPPITLNTSSFDLIA